MLIRAARSGELATVLSMYDWLFAPPGTRPRTWAGANASARLRRLSTDARGIVLVAEIEGALVGFATVVLDIESVRFGQRAWMEDLAVDPSHRSEGIGRQLLAAAKAWARAQGASHLELDSADAREDAHRFYERERPSWRSICFGWEL